MPTKVHETALIAVDYPKIEITTFKCSNALELVSCIVENPLYAVYVTVPTLVTDNKGLPHTLEHLIFCGSHDYPERGYLDRLAGLCQSQGTNAYTTDDHTCYTFVTSSLGGLLRLLPVFLDHIFRPTLADAIIRREVFHRGESGGKGVVYCEMGGREWSEQDLLDLALRRGAIEGEMGVYGWECGGKTADIARLQLEEIREYHRRYYRPDNVCVVLVGGEELKASTAELHQIMESVQFLPQVPISPITVPVIERVPTSVIRFPSNDESLGSVGFSWPGPPSDDIYTITGLHVLMRMLKDTSASPLYQHFVERPDPIASDIDYEVKASYQTIISLIFSGVPTTLQSDKDSDCYLSEGALWKELHSLLEKFRDDAELMEERRKVALKSVTIKMQECLEDDPHDIVAAYCMPEIVRTHWPFTVTTTENHRLPKCGEAITMMPNILQRLSGEPLSYWVGLMEKYLLLLIPTEVRMMPSREMSDEIKQIEAAQLDGIPIIELEADNQESSTIIESSPCGRPTNIKCKISHPSSGTQVVTIPSAGVKRLTLAFDISKNVEKSRWPYLVLFQELLFQSDVHITEELIRQYSSPLFTVSGLIPYQTLIEQLSGVFSTFEGAVGFDNDLFSCAYLDSHFIISLHGRVTYTLCELVNSAKMILAGTLFTAERITEVLENVISQLKDSWGEADSVLDARLTGRLSALHGMGVKRARATNGVPMVEVKLGLVTQTEQLVSIRKQMETNPAPLLTILEGIRKELLGAEMLINFGNNQECEMDDDGQSPLLWPEAYSLPKHGSLEGVIVNEDGMMELIPMSDITSSYMTISVPLDILPRGGGKEEDNNDDKVDRLLGASLLCQLLSYTEGPLYRRIRGAGLAYGASVSVAVWSGLLTFHLSDSSDPVNALAVFMTMIDELMSNPGNIITEETLRTAQAGMLFQFVTERATHSAIVSTALRTALRGLPSVGSVEEGRWNERMASLTVPELNRLAIELLPALKDPQKAIRLLAVPASKVDTIKREFEANNVSCVINKMVELAHQL